MAAIPDSSLIHAIAVFSSQQDHITAFARRVQRMIPGIAPDPAGWTAVREPRESLSGPLSGAGWQWHVLFDMGGIPDKLQPAVKQCRFSDAAATALRSHQSAGALFLLEAPPEVGPFERFQDFCRLTWEWLELGATAIVWPQGRKASSAAELKHLQPKDFTADDFEVCVSIAAAGKPVGGQQWLRTYGMSQFDLPDLAAQVSTDTSRFGAESAYAQTLFGSLPPYFIERAAAFQPGESIELEDQVWRCTGPADAKQSPELVSGKFGTQIFVRDQK
jgi:hypothetical protein